ncbi:MAG TPA: N-methyl-L-tryptophan oxidase [Thermomicrobiales bacterium]|nr:N-methyl-L-tryptophan oxidase [Thermomicrobiales bacterium]
MASNQTDVIVIGGGTMGTAAGWALARQGRRVTVLEQHQHIHTLGSHSGHTRIFRHAYAEGPRYVPWTVEADGAWAALQERTSLHLMKRTGCLDLAAPGFGHARAARASAEAYDIAHETLTGAEVVARYPAWNLPADWEACLDPTAGFLIVEPAMRALATELRAHGGEIREHEHVLSWNATADGVNVATETGTYEAEQLIVTAGAWAGKLLSDLSLPLEVRRKPVFWFDVERREPFLPERFPVFIAENAQGEFYGLPIHGEDSIKIGVHSGGEAVDPDTMDRAVSDADLLPELMAFIAECLPGVRPRLTASSVCMYTMTPDEDFLIDRHPEHERVVFAAGFSGHGFKFAPVVGEYLAALATDAAAPVRPEFALARFAGVR